MSKSTDSAISFGVGILAGVLGGVIAGVLFAPKPGSEMRNDLSAVVKKIASEKSPRIIYINKINTEKLARLQYTIESQFNKAIDAIKANKMASAKEKEELQMYN
jgi:gas vesicle protein